MEAKDRQERLYELNGWRPEGGVLSVYVEIDPGDRSDAWRIELRHALDGLDKHTAARVFEHFSEGEPPPPGRTHAGFLEIGEPKRRDLRDIWHGYQMGLGRTRAFQTPRPYLAPLVQLLDEGWPLGVVVVALEQVRVFEWALGEIEELDGWELETYGLDWRERKAPRVDPARGTSTSASGGDQYDERLDHNREAFLREAGKLIASRYGDRTWRRLIVIGETDRPKLLSAGLGSSAWRVHEVHHDLIGDRPSQIAARVEQELDPINRGRELELIAAIEEAIGSEPGAALGPDEVLVALEEARVHHVVFDATREWDQRDGVEISELMIEHALASGAGVTPVEGEAAAALEKRDGAAALLRY
jgi:hypothetical protein